MLVVVEFNDVIVLVEFFLLVLSFEGNEFLIKVEYVGLNYVDVNFVK